MPHRRPAASACPGNPAPIPGENGGGGLAWERATGPRRLWLLVALLTCVVSAGRLSAQEAKGAKAAPAAGYNELPFADQATLREKKRVKDEMLKGAMPYSEAGVRDYYIGFLLPAMTRVSGLEMNNEARREIFEDIDKAEKAGDAVYGPFGNFLADTFAKVATNNFHPAAGINAVLVLNRLNKSRPRAGLAPEPHPKTMAVLMNLATQGKNDGIRAAALAGFERCIDVMQGTWNDQVRSTVSQGLLTMLKEPKPGKRTARADGWLKGRAMELLVKFKHPHEAEVFRLAMANIANVESDPILVEKSLMVLGSYPVPANLKPEEVKLTLIAGLNYARTGTLAWQKSLRGAEMFFMSSGDSSGEEMAEAEVPEEPSTEEGVVVKKKKEPKDNPYAKQPPDVKLKRRVLHEHLQGVRLGLTGTRFGALPESYTLGLAALVPDGENGVVMKEIAAAIKDLQDTINKPELMDRPTMDLETTPKIDELTRGIDDLLAMLGYEVPADAAAPSETPTPADPLTEGLTTVDPFAK
jgi:hypothetical protein